MRWSLRRADRSDQGLGAGDPAPAPELAAPSEPAAAVDGRGWTALAPIAPSWAARPLLTAGPLPVAPSITERLPAAGHPRPSAGEAPSPGLVVGLARVVPVALAVPVTTALPTTRSGTDQPAGTDAAPAVELPGRYREQPPLRHVSARPVVEHAPLTRATDEFVGEPIAPPPPPARAPMPSPPPGHRPDPAIEAATEAGARFREALAQLSNRGVPDGLPGQASMSTPASATPLGDPFGDPFGGRPARRDADEVPPPEDPAPARPAVPGLQPRDPRDSGPPPPPLTHRRNSLAQSRRLGLGAPMQADDGPTPAPEPPAAAPAPGPAPAPAPEGGTAANAEMTRALAQARAEQERADAAYVERLTAQQAAADRAEAELAQVEARSSDGPGGGSAPPRSGGTGAAAREGDTAADGPASALGRESLRPAAVVRPITDGTVRPTASTTPLRFRAALRDRAGAQDTVAPVERAVVTRPPAELAQALRSSHGVDVADIEVRRESEVAAEASRRRARAFTRGAAVHLPEAAGPLDSTPVRALLAHELVHAAQQRRLGSSLPAEHTPEGRALEHEALEAERAYGGTPPEITSDEPLRHAQKPVSTSWVEDRLTQHALDLGEPPRQWPLDEPQVRVVQYLAQEMVRDQIADGTVGGRADATQDGGGGATASGGARSGGGSGATAEELNRQGTVGALQARSEQELQQQVLGVINMQRKAQNLSPLAALTDAQNAEVAQQWNEAQLERALAGPGRSKGTMLWTADKGFHSPDAPAEEPAAGGTAGAAGVAAAAAETAAVVATNAAAVATSTVKSSSSATAGSTPAIPAPILPPAAPSGTDGPAIGGHRAAAEGAAVVAGAAAAAGAAWVSATPKPAAPATATTPAATPAATAATTATAARSAPVDLGVGSLGALTFEDFESQMLGVVNMQLGAMGQPAKTAFTATERQQIRAQWQVAKQDHDMAMVGETLKVQSRAVAAERQRSAQASTDGAAAGMLAGTAAAAGAAAAAAASTGTSAATTATAQSGGSAGSVTHPALDPEPLDLERIDVEDLVTRIYDRVRSRLRFEFLIDRERAGLLTDFR